MSYGLAKLEKRRSPIRKVRQPGSEEFESQ
jgi:hypothetical protein